jgi:hypothetical protein
MKCECRLSAVEPCADLFLTGCALIVPYGLTSAGRAEAILARNPLFSNRFFGGPLETRTTGDCAKKAVRPRHRRELGRWTRTVFALSTRRVSGLIMINRSTMNYRSRRDPQHALRVQMRELAASRVRFGYRFRMRSAFI